MHIMGGKQKKQMLHGLTPSKRSREKKLKKYFLLLLLPNLFMEGAHMREN